MSHLEIILPFCIPPAALAPDLLRQLHTPAFAKLIALASLGDIQQAEDFCRLLPHESWLAGHFLTGSRSGIAPSAAHLKELRQTSPANTHFKMQQFGLTPADGFWFTFNPVHIHIARDHLVLTDQRRLALSETEARALFEAAAGICAELGKQLRYGDARTWFLRADDWQDLRTSTMDAACGHNIEIWLPQGAYAQAWRKLQNEIQMLWHIHPVNAEREMRGENIVNSAWLHGGSSALQTAAPALYTSYQALAQAIATGNKQDDIRLLLDTLLEPALNNDWAAWLDAMHQMEADVFVPVLTALGKEDYTELSLIVTDAVQLARFKLNRRSLWKFWKKPSLQPLFTIPTP